MRWLICCLLIGWCSSVDIFPDAIRQAAFNKIISNYYLNDPFTRQGRDYVNPTAPYHPSGPSRPPKSSRYTSNARRKTQSKTARRPTYTAPAYSSRPSYSEPEPLDLDYLPPPRSPHKKSPEFDYLPPRRRPSSSGSSQYRKPEPYSDLEGDYLPPPRQPPPRQPPPKSAEPYSDLEGDYLPPPRRPSTKSSEPSYADIELDYLPPPRRPSHKAPEPSYQDLELDYLPPRRVSESRASKSVPSYSNREWNRTPPSRRPSYTQREYSSPSKRKRNTYVQRDPWRPDFCSFFDDGPSDHRVKRRRVKSVAYVNNNYHGQMKHPSDWPDLFYGDLGRFERSHRRAG